ncbi:MAG: hypothetical protein AAGD07_24210 [Planctomycetota bacterium]
MAGDWIKLEHATPDKPEVIAMASILSVDDHDLVWAKCVRIWIWLDQQTVDGNAVSVTDSFIDRFTRVTGFAKALRKVGWLSGRDGHLSVPNFERHNGKSAKTRANTAKRVQKNRQSCNGSSVTNALPEKRREEKSNTLSPPRKKTVDLGAEIPSQLEELWSLWMDTWESRTGRRMDPGLAQHQLGELLRLPIDKAERDLRFSLSKQSKSILDSDDDYSKRRPRGGAGTKSEIDI